MTFYHFTFLEQFQYRVFDKNEANIFRENYKIKQDCLKAIRNILIENNMECSQIVEKLKNRVILKHKSDSELIINYLDNQFCLDLK